MPILMENRSLVTPGEIIADGKYKIGSNVYRHGPKIISQVIGLVDINNNKISVVPLKGNYIPTVGDLVIGIVTDVALNSWIVDVGSAYPAIMKSSSINKRFDPVRDDSRDFFDVGEVVVGKIYSFDRTRDPVLTLRENDKRSRGPYLGKLNGGRVVEITPTKIPRLIGRRGSMISMIKHYTNCRITVGQNGRIWIKGDNVEDEYLVLQAINKIEREAHTSGLTDRVKELLEEEKAKQQAEKDSKKD